MARSRGKSKGKKGKKKHKRKVRKFNLDLFGILTFTRLHGPPFEDFMCGKKEKKKELYHVKASRIRKKDKKKYKKNDAPDLPKFAELPPLPIVRVKGKTETGLDFSKDPIIPYVNVGYQAQEKTTRPNQPLQRAGSIRDVLCGPKFPLPPRPQPHGGVFGDRDCGLCRMMDYLFKDAYHKLPKKMRKVMEAEFDKAKYILQYLINHARKGTDQYREHIKNMVDVLDPMMDAIDNSEWDDHFEVRKLIDKWKQLQRELLRVKAEYRHLRDHQDEEIERLLADKLAEVQAAEKRLREVEQQLKDAIDTLQDWREHGDQKLKGPQDEIDRLLALLEAVKNSVFVERDNLRDLLAWETKMATEQTVAEMERIISEDLNYILNAMHPAWFNLVFENQKLAEEDKILTAENHLLELEVETLNHQLNQLLGQKKKFEQTKTHGFRPPQLKATVDRFFKHGGRVQLYEFPVTELLHE